MNDTRITYYTAEDERVIALAVAEYADRSTVEAFCWNRVRAEAAGAVFRSRRPYKATEMLVHAASAWFCDEARRVAVSNAPLVPANAEDWKGLEVEDELHERLIRIGLQAPRFLEFVRCSQTGDTGPVARALERVLDVENERLEYHPLLGVDDLGKDYVKETSLEDLSARIKELRRSRYKEPGADNFILALEAEVRWNRAERAKKAEQPEG